MADLIAPPADQERGRQQMRALARRPLTANDFLHLYEGAEGRWELVEGEPVMMTGGTFRHADVAGNIYFALRDKLRGQNCRPFNADAGVGIDLHNIRYPDVTVYCDPRDLDVNLSEKRTGQHPVVIFEVASPSTAALDRGLKLQQYKALPSVQHIVFVNPDEQTVELYARAGESAWEETVLAPGADLPLPSIGTALTARDMFRAD